MSDVPPVWILMTTYKRTDTALKTIRGIKENFIWPNLGFVLVDDGTGGDHLQQLKDEVGGSYSLVTYDSGHKGVGSNMNYGLRKIWEMGADLTLLLEDDWLLEKPFDPTAGVNLLMNHADVGMIRYGYYSAGLNTKVFAREDHLWHWFLQDGNTYVYTGHANLRHRRFHQQVGMFSEGLAPGENELDFCGKYNRAYNAPKIVWDADFGKTGPFVHIGSESLADIKPG